MGDIKNKIYDWKNRLRKGKMLTLVVTLIIIILTLIIFVIIKSKQYRELSENSNNQAFYELVEHINNTEKLLGKSTISNDSKHESIVLTSIWRSASLAQAYLSRIPIKVEELENANKFLNQVGDYCFVLSKKSINGESLTEEEIDNLSSLYSYSILLKDTINQLENDLYSGNIKWGELRTYGNKAFKEDKDNLESSSFSSIEEDLHQYTGLIYDGAFSENQNNFKGEGLTGEDIDENKAKELVEEFYEKDRIIEIQSRGESENARINCYCFNIKCNNDTETIINISKKGGHIISMNNNRDVNSSDISEEDAIKKGKEYLDSKDFKNMKETYYMREDNILTINYAYTENDVIIYPDLVKVKIAMDNSEILGIEATNYLNSHKEHRNIESVEISKEKALERISNKVEIQTTNLAIIPTEYNTEILCWEIKGKVKKEVNSIKIENDFLVYINATTGKEEDILMIVDTPNGTLTM